MSKTILAQVDGFTPVIDSVVADVGATTALVFGKVWRYCQMADGVCKASQERIADELGMSRQTIITHIKKLIAAGYIEDMTPDIEGHPHQYRDTGKAGLSINLTATAQPVKNFDTTCQKIVQPPVKNFDTKIVLRDEEETGAPAPFGGSKTRQKAVSILTEVSRLATVPMKEMGHLETVCQLIDTYGEEQTRNALQTCFNRWVATPGKNGRTYSPINFGWVDWAIADISGQSPEEPAPLPDMTAPDPREAEYIPAPEWMQRGRK